MDENNSPVVDESVETPVETQSPESDAILEALETEDSSTASTPDEKQEQEQPETEVQPKDEQTEESEEELQSESDPKEEARKRYEERQQQRESRRQMFNERATEESEKLRQGAEDEYDQRLKDVEAREYEREVERYVERIENTENSLVNEFERAKANPDLQLFNPDNKEAFDPRAYSKAIKDFNAGYVQYDNAGNMVGVKGSLFEHLTETADLLRGATKSGQVQQVRADRQLKQNADIKPAVTPKEPQKDAILDILMSD